MARERYLIGVEPEELTPREQSPQTPRGKWANFWHYHKWLVIGIVAVVALLVSLTVHTLTRVEPDHLICMVTMQEVTPSADARLETILEQYTTDRNGDGKVRVEVHCLNVSTGDGEYINASATANQQAALGHILSRDVDLWAVDPSFYSGTLHSALEGDESRFFIPLDTIDASGISADKKYWNWEAISLLTTDEELKNLPKTLYWGVRVLPDDASEELQTRVADALTLLKTFVDDQK